MPHRRCKNATSVLGMGEPTSIMLVQVAIALNPDFIGAPYTVTIVVFRKGIT